MLRYLQGLNWTLLALGATFTIVLSVVCLLLFIYLDTAPEYRPQFESMRTNTLLFASVMACAAVAVWSQRRHHRLRWPAEIMLMAAVFVTVQHFLPK